jgi:hypothetical protein
MTTFLIILYVIAYYAIGAICVIYLCKLAIDSLAKKITKEIISTLKKENIIKD